MLSPPEIAGYEILSELGRGAMGVVYRAQQLRLFNRPVALKMILAGSHASADQLSRFRTEAEAVARLQHPNIVQIYEVGEHNGLPYFSLELVEGGSLLQHLDGTPIPPHDAAQLVETVAHAVHAAHQRGIIHRDLKPGNVLLTADGTPKITDFGLAKKIDSDAGQTASGAIVGTPSYMAPEQARRNQTRDRSQEAVGPAADIYALGAILYELLTGRPPFKAATYLETILQVVSQEPAPPRLLQPSAPRDLETICLKCLQMEPRQRYATAEELSQDLRRFRECKPITARPVGLLERGWRWCRRNRLVAGLLAAVALSLVGGTGLASYFAWQAGARAREALAAEKRAETSAAYAAANAERADAKAAEADANARRADHEARHAREQKRTADHLVYVAHMSLTRQAWEDSQSAWMRELLESHLPERTGGEDLRGFEWYHWWRLCHFELLTLGHSAKAVRGIAYSPDGTRLATASEDGTLTIWDAGNGQKLRVLPHDAPVTCLAFSRDGKRLASGTALRVGPNNLSAPPPQPATSEIRIWDTATGDLLFHLAGPAADINSLAFNPRGDRLAAGCNDQAVYVWDLDRRRQAYALKGGPGSAYHTGMVQGVAFSADGARFASASQDHSVKIWEAETGKPIRTLNHNSRVFSVAFSPDGTRLATAVEAVDAKTGQLGNSQIQVWDLRTGQPTLSLPPQPGAASGVAFSPDGRRLAGAAGPTAQVWDTLTGRRILSLMGHAGTVTGVCFQPDGRRLATASADGTAKVWDAVASTAVVIQTGQGGGVSSLAISPDGQRLVTASPDKSVRVWQAADGQRLLTLPAHLDRVASVAYSPDGQGLATASGTEVKVWDAANGDLTLTFKRHTNAVNQVVFSPDGRYLASGGEDWTIRLWDAANGREIRVFEGHKDSVLGLAFRADVQRLASCSRDRTVRVWDTATGKEVLVLKGLSNPVQSVAFDREGRRLAAAFADWTVMVWDANTGEPLVRPLRGHMGPVTSVAFSPDGQRLATGSEDQTVKLWDPTTGQEVLSFKGFTDGVTAVAFSTDGQHLVGASQDGSVRVWEAPVLPQKFVHSTGNRSPP
jgi:WD40 repeat protein